MKKNCKVVMLPTEKESSPISKMHDRYFQLINGGYKDLTCMPQHLYLISDDEIKEGDTYINEDNRLILHKNKLLPKGKKVIASTDPELCLFNKPYMGDISSAHIQLPAIPTKFIKAYVEANGIDEVMVEYDSQYVGKMNTDGIAWGPVLTDNNEVIIHLPEEKMYSRANIKSMGYQLVEFISSQPSDKHSEINKEESFRWVDKWIEENL